MQLAKYVSETGKFDHFKVISKDNVFHSKIEQTFKRYLYLKSLILKATWTQKSLWWGRAGTPGAPHVCLMEKRTRPRSGAGGAARSPAARTASQPRLKNPDHVLGKA